MSKASTGDQLSRIMQEMLYVFQCWLLCFPSKIIDSKCNALYNNDVRSINYWVYDFFLTIHLL